MHDSLFQPLTMGALEARNRVFMAPLTRGRSTQPGSVPNEMMATYYRQRASAGLIISLHCGKSTPPLGRVPMQNWGGLCPAGACMMAPAF